MNASKKMHIDDIAMLLPHIKLRFNIDHPSLEECYAFGYECAMAEVTEDANPYHFNSLEYQHWQDGWWDGFYKEEPLFELGTVSDAASHIPVSEEAIKVGPQHSAESTANFKLFTRVVQYTGAIAATAIIGYQLLDLVA